MSQLIIALSKGRILKDTLPLLKVAGIELLEDPEKSRKLIFPTTHPQVQIVIIRATDVPTYVENGAADVVLLAKTCNGTPREWCLRAFRFKYRQMSVNGGRQSKCATCAWPFAYCH